MPEIRGDPGDSVSSATKPANDGEVSAADALRAKEDQIARLIAAFERVADHNAKLMDQNARLMEAVLGGRGPLAMVPAAAPPPAVPATSAPEYIPPPAPVAPPPAPQLITDTVTFAEIWDAYCAHLSTKKWLGAAKSMVKRALHHFAPSLCIKGPIRGRRKHGGVLYGPDMLVSAMRPYHWTDLRNTWIKLEPDLKVSSRNHMLQRVKACLNWAVDDGRIPSNPLARVKLEKKRPKRETTISDEGIERLKSPLLRAYLLTIVDSGLRPGEARILRKDQFDSDLRTELSWTTTKGQKSRPAWITPRVLEAWKELPDRPGNDYVFGAPRGNRPYSASHIGHLFQMERREAGMVARPGDHFPHLHDGRRSFASRLTKNGVSIYIVKELLGHSQVATTEGYISVDEIDLLKGHGQLDAAKRRPPQSKKPDS